MVRYTVVFASFLLSACAPAPVGDGAKAAGTPRFGQDWSVTFDLNSWGRPMAHWIVRADGTGELWKAPGVSHNFSEYDLEKYRLQMDATAMAKFVEVSEPLKAATRDEVKCETTVTDAPYGTMTWINGKDVHRYQFNFGCTSAPADVVYERIGEAQDVVNKLARIDAEPYAVEHIGR
ncbi:MAG: hypothetical protein AB7F98_12530 [Novosphingobium sp.]